MINRIYYMGSKITITIHSGDLFFILNFSLVFRYLQLGYHANEIKHDHSPVVIVLLEPRYEK